MIFLRNKIYKTNDINAKWKVKQKICDIKITHLETKQENIILELRI